MFLTPGLVIGSYITGIPFTDEERVEMIRYLMNHANEDGGWGMYVSHLSRHVCRLIIIVAMLKGRLPRLEPP